MDAIIAHPWFSDIDFDALLAKTIEPPFKPELTDNIDDTSNFDDQFTNLDPTNSMMP